MDRNANKAVVGSGRRKNDALCEGGSKAHYERLNCVNKCFQFKKHVHVCVRACRRWSLVASLAAGWGWRWFSGPLRTARWDGSSAGSKHEEKTGWKRQQERKRRSRAHVKDKWVRLHSITLQLFYFMLLYPLTRPQFKVTMFIWQL